MNCVHVQTSLAEDLLSRTDEEVAAHLSACPDCSRLCDELLELEDLSRSLSGRFRVPTEFRDEVLARLAERKARRRRRFGVAAAVALVALLLAVFVRPWETSRVTDRHAGVPPVVMQLAAPVGQGQTGSDYVDVVVTQDGGEDLILRVPSVIEIHRTQLQEDFYISNVSH
jgi:hypothetical protein